MINHAKRAMAKVHPPISSKERRQPIATGRWLVPYVRTSAPRIRLSRPAAKTIGSTSLSRRGGSSTVAVSEVLAHPDVYLGKTVRVVATCSEIDGKRVICDVHAYDRGRLKFINLPVLKSHHATYGATAAVKHYMGVVSGELATNSHSSIYYGLMGALLAEIQPVLEEDLQGSQCSEFEIGEAGSAAGRLHRVESVQQILIGYRPPGQLDTLVVAIQVGRGVTAMTVAERTQH